MFLDDVAEYPLVENTSKDALFNMNVWFERYLEFLEIEKVSDKTKKAYSEALTHFLFFISEHKEEIRLQDIGAKFINRYINYYQFLLAKKAMDYKKISDVDYYLILKQYNAKSLGTNDANFDIVEQFQNTIIQRLTVLKMFLKFITENNKDLHDYVKVFQKIVKVKVKEKETFYLTTKELQEVIDFMQNWVNVFKKYKKKSSLRYAYRDALLLLIYALTGARSEEVVLLKLSDIQEMEFKDEHYYIIKISNAKGGKIRSVSIKKSYIEKFIHFFESNLLNEDYYISSTFQNNQYLNKPYHPNNIRKFANFILKLLNINKSGLHAFRRGYATKRLMVDHADISLVAKEIGNTPEILHKHYFKHNIEDIMDKRYS